MNFAGLQTFLKIVHTGSLVRASEVLNVTQSTVTARLKGLENELGQVLLHRQKSGAELTAAGFKFKRYAELMNDLWRMAKLETSLPANIEAVLNFGCDVDLWPGLGQRIFDEIYGGRPTIGLSIWPGAQVELDRWLGAGLIDVALTFQPFAHENQTIYDLGQERLVLVTTRSGSPMRFDPQYVYVHSGEDFAQKHSAAFADADTAKINFACAVWALEHLMEHGGSAYLPERLVKLHILAGRLFHVSDAPIFARNIYLVTNNVTAVNWPELPELAKRLVGNVAVPTPAFFERP